MLRVSFALRTKRSILLTLVWTVHKRKRSYMFLVSNRSMEEIDQEVGLEGWEFQRAVIWKPSVSDWEKSTVRCSEAAQTMEHFWYQPVLLDKSVMCMKRNSRESQEYETRLGYKEVWVPDRGILMIMRIHCADERKKRNFPLLQIEISNKTSISYS